MEDEKTEILDRIDDFRDAVKTIPSREILESEDVPTLLSRYEKIRQTLVTEDRLNKYHNEAIIALKWLEYLYVGVIGDQTQTAFIWYDQRTMAQCETIDDVDRRVRLYLSRLEVYAIDHELARATIDAYRDKDLQQGTRALSLYVFGTESALRDIVWWSSL